MTTMTRWMTKLAALFADSRRQPRIPTDLQASLSGPLGAAAVRCTDLNKRGAAIRSLEALEPGALVFLRLSAFRLAGFAWVRHCSPVEGEFLIGLEFRDGLTRERSDEPGWSLTKLTPTLAWVEGVDD